MIISCFGNRKYMRGHFQSIFPTVGAEDLLCVDSEITERVDGNQNWADVRLLKDEPKDSSDGSTHVNLCILVPFLQVLRHCFVADRCKECHV